MTEAIYVLSDPDTAKFGKYKIGITTRNRKYLLRDYRRSRPQVQLHLFQECVNSKEIESKVLSKFKDKRILHESGNPSEWLQIDLRELMIYINKLLGVQNNKIVSNIKITNKNNIEYPISEYLSSECVLSWYSYESCQTLYDGYLSKVPKDAQKLGFLNFCKRILDNLTDYHKVSKDRIKYKKDGVMYYRGIVLKSNYSMMGTCVLI